jgi:two-component system cell cycle sensor histidine kinase/response regulator CckA
MNPVSNAAEAIEDRGEVRICTTNCYMDKPVSRYSDVKEGDYMLLSVEDTGSGIAAKDLIHIFEPFYTKKIMGRSGTGLGMAVVWGAVQDHYGYIDVQSQPGQGTRIDVYLPITREALPDQAEGLPMQNFMGKGEKLLIVDDVAEQRAIAGNILAELGYLVNTANSGEEAVAFIRKYQVDLLVLDMIMDPGMDGLDTYEHILTLKPHQKAIIVSGFSETERVKKAQALGAGAYLKKPYVMNALAMAVRTELDRS